jgi:predicted Rossmann-fold nucleotide-binding protein
MSMANDDGVRSSVESAYPLVKQTHANGARQTQMPLKIGVMGGATGVVSREILDGAHALGRAIAASGCILVTGGCPGLPLAAACGAKEVGGFAVGISPGLSLGFRTARDWLLRATGRST